MLLMSKNKAGSVAKPALFLDRDGVINIDYGHVHVKENFNFKPGIFELVYAANEAGYLCVVVTNQAGIGRGLYSTEDFRTLSNWMCRQFENKGALIDAIYYSPFHPTEGKGKYLLEEDTRKPGAGMFHEAVDDLDIDVSRSIMVGDKISDMKASVLANVARSYLLYSHQNLDMSQELDESVSLIYDLDTVTSQLLR
jgi:D-glycero-D-manno-heptose 1,7-bisphosphate phosphatase